jgi:hypothetical protein
MTIPSGMAPDEDEAHVRSLHDDINGNETPRQLCYERGTRVANTTSHAIIAQKSSCICISDVYVPPMLASNILIRHEVFFAYPS